MFRAMAAVSVISMALAVGGCTGLDTGGGGDTQNIDFQSGLAYLNNGDVYVADRSDFENKTQRLTSGAGNALPTLSRDGRVVAFVHTDTASLRESLLRISSSGGALSTLIDVSTRQYTGLAWSADGAQLFFTADRVLSVINADGSGETVVSSSGDFSSPSVSAAGALWVLDGDTFKGVSGGVLGAGVSLGSASPARGAISPDGTRIVYEDGNTHEIWVVPAAGGASTQLTSITSGQQSDPAWSGDGSQIFFVSDVGGAEKIYATDSSASLSSGTLIQVGSEPSWGG